MSPTPITRPPSFIPSWPPTLWWISSSNNPHDPHAAKLHCRVGREAEAKESLCDISDPSFVNSFAKRGLELFPRFVILASSRSPPISAAPSTWMKIQGPILHY
ncbi:hypothetical protein NW759_007420 [Fusarium solani]|nr:hypothetical protein NW759_007420 [Fusarium solani]